ncbi:hypothetical protein, partial [Novipirellula caenicola]|uniref:hypothetical protein n=1 Tax=Novipirellula caenicola TaxID=1536901 RepID=UPI0031E6A311
MRRRSQKGRNLSWEAYGLYLERHPLPNPGQITDLIAMGSAKCCQVRGVGWEPDAPAAPVRF